MSEFKLTEEQQEEMLQKLDEWTVEKAVVIFTTKRDTITLVRVFKEGKYYTLLRCFWMIDHPEISVDLQEVEADSIILKLGKNLGSLY